MSRTYGALSLLPAQAGGDPARPQWLLRDIEPHVAIRLKSLFPKVPKQSPGPFSLPHDALHCADLSWFITRYPLAMSADDAAALRQGEQDFRATQATMEGILLPDYVAGRPPGLRDGQQLRHYQAQAVELLRHRGSLLLGDEGGLGKTYTAGAFLAGETGALPAAVVVDAHMQRQWQQKLEAFTSLSVHRIRKASPYDLPTAEVYVFRISQIAGWVDIFATGYFKAVVYDEPQSLRTGCATAKGMAARVLSEHARFRLGCTATPIYNYGNEMWNVMRFIDERVLGAFEDFQREWCSNTGRITDPRALGTYLREQHALLRRLKADVGLELPRVSRIVETVSTDNEAIESVEALARRLAIRATTGSFVERGHAARELDIMVRQATGVGKARSVAQFARMMVAAGEPVLLVGWHRAVYDIWLDELADLQPAMYTGSESATQKARSVEDFLAGRTDILILSLRSGAGIDGLQQRCSVVIIGELDWSPGIHQQVIWRVDREGQQHPVTVFFLVSEDGSDPPVMDVLGIKASEATHIFDPHLGASAAAGDEHHLQRLVARYLARTPTPVSAAAPAAEHSTELNRRFSAAECDPTRRR